MQVDAVGQLDVGRLDHLEIRVIAASNNLIHHRRTIGPKSYINGFAIQRRFGPSHFSHEAQDRLLLLERQAHAFLGHLDDAGPGPISEVAGLVTAKPPIQPVP